MKANLRVWSELAGCYIDSEDMLMELAKLDSGMGFEDIGIQGDGTPVVFDKCGNFGYLDANKYRIDISLSFE